MSDNQGKVIPIAIEDEVKESYLNYAMSVIVSRALPDVRDGLKPVHRRILYSMSEMGIRYNSKEKKCGRIVGDVLGKFHPHGDQSIYDALVRMAQEFSLREPLVHGQGNFGSVDGDPPAAMRYTEAKMAKISEAMLRDIKKETVDFVPNYDDSMMEPAVLPAAFPALLVNGSNGIAVGMATNMPPHNLSEVCDAVCALIENPESTIEDLLEYVKGPDYPTGASIYGKVGIRMAAQTGRGKIIARANYHLEDLKGDREAIIITELPYQVNKAKLVERIADLVKEKRIEGISELRDESDRQGMRVVIELKRNIPTKVVLNHLFSLTPLQSNFNVINLALVDGKPKLCNLKQMLEYFISHRQEVIRRRCIFDLAKAKARAHILEGLKIALDNIDEIVDIIKKSANVNMARVNLMERFSFSEKQAQAILDMRLQKLTSLETQKIIDELNEVLAEIAYLEDLLAHEEKILAVINEETQELKEKYGNPRRTQIVPEELETMNMEDFIKKENMVVLISNRGFIKRIAVSEYKEQSRGGKGSNTSKLKDDDFIEHMFIANTHTHIMFVTNKAKAYWLKVYEIPEGSRASKGKHLRTIFEFEDDEEITASVPLEEFKEDQYLFMATRKAIVKRVSTYDFRNAKMRGIRAIELDEGDSLVSAKLTYGKGDVMLVTKKGKGLRINEDTVRCMGRVARGVRGIKLAEGDELVGMCNVDENYKMLLISEFGYGKRTDFNEFAPHGRGTGGQKAYGVNSKTGELIGVMSVLEEDSIICITTQGKAIRMPVHSISINGRAAFGVRVLNTGYDDRLIGIARQEKENEDHVSSEEEDDTQLELLDGEQKEDVSRETTNEDNSEE
ncbi:MAG: DNA topoisomerase (ATP-hydrolyzing) subunit A [Spirochaetales bacterium]|nr:DNA topoisomerase (ATP-hydrolyzing) subunit A [Spirochaetales bacterium]